MAERRNMSTVIVREKDANIMSIPFSGFTVTCPEIKLYKRGGWFDQREKLKGSLSVYENIVIIPSTEHLGAGDWELTVKALVDDMEQTQKVRIIVKPRNDKAFD